MDACSKKPFLKPEDAWTAARVIERRNRSRGVWLPRGIHPCSSCRAWHITSKRQSRQRSENGRQPERLKDQVGLDADAGGGAT